ncbi:MAG: site-2 protease family protein [Clostridia bacterium]|nr:site-2 protease family protein [Clostridia bacterium]
MKVKLSIHPVFIIFAVILGYLGYFSLLFFYVLTLVLHECAHAFVAQKLGYKLNHITLMPYGAAVSGQDCFFSKTDEIKVALAGPILNLFISVFGCALWWIEPVTYAYTSEFVYSNWVVGIVNLLPIFPLDGGRILHAILCKKYSSKQAIDTVRKVGIILSSLLIVGFLITTIYVPNYTMLVFGGFVFISSVVQDKASYYSSIDFLENKQIKLRSGIKIKEIAVTKDMPLYRLFSYLSRDELTNFCVLSADFSVIANISEIQLKDWLRVYPANTTLDSIITK